VKGATRELLYGADTNHNGVVDIGEDETGTNASTGTSTTGGVTGFSGNARCGIMKFLTVYSLEANTDSTGKARVNVNTASNQQLQQLFGNSVTGDRMTAILAKVRTAKPFRSPFDFYYKLSLTLDEFKKVIDKITVLPSRTLPGLINVNTAPKEVLRCLPGLEDGDADALVERRNSSGTVLTNTAWVLETLPQTKAVAISNFITTKTKRFSAEVVGVGPGGRGFKRMRCVFDVRGSAPKIVFSKDLSHLGWPLETSLLDSLRSGQGLGANATSSPSLLGGANSSNGAGGGNSLGGAR